MPTRTSKSLFSEHYLQRRLPGHPEWQEDSAAALAAARTLYEAKKSLLPLYNEAQTEQAFIRPLLEEVLGFEGAYTVQATAHQQGQIQRPDYALFANSAGKLEADHYLQDEPAFYARAVAVADAKYWERALSQREGESGREVVGNRNPSHQIVSYLVATGVDWGILTNGRQWRLYSRTVSGLATEFYEVDLVQILTERPEDFRRFWLFFRRRAFLPDHRGHSFLDRVRAGSARYARVVGDRLKERVFDEIFPLLAGGFVEDMARAGENPETEEARRRIYEGTLSLLYKLLFLLYGEARSLLPIDNRGYQYYSLTGMAEQVAGRLDRGEPLGERATGLYTDLIDLFRLVDEGDKGIGLPRYNGGLFDFAPAGSTTAEGKQQENAFLTHHQVNDRRLARVLDLLGRVDGEAVDYGYLGVRHLGAIYEGLLEYRLVVDSAEPGATAVHLENDRGERKVTGSYYTPDYIVKYIVRHTLEPIVVARAERFGEQMEEIEQVRAQLGDPRQMDNVKLLRQRLVNLEREARETLLDLKVVDPAMGSGHFLVEVVDFLTTRLVTILNRHPEHNPLLSWLAQIRQQILANMEEQGISVDTERLDDTQLLQRVVMKRCIYGVDLNRMAVELAKLSLWLHTFTVGAPLSFLDHHLRWGNSLVGSMAREAEAQLAPEGTPAQIAFTFMSGPFAGMLQAAEIMRGIAGLSDATLAEVEQSEALFRAFDEQVEPYKKLLDVFTMGPFLDKEGQQAASDFLLHSGPEALALAKAGPEAAGEEADRQVLARARDLFLRHRFLHWDLEFPEVFINLERAAWKENGGFDAVVGNPPYVRQEQLQAVKPYLPSAYEPVYHGMADLYVYFYYRGFELLREGGQLSFIVTNKWFRAGYGEGVRGYLAGKGDVRQIVDFGHAPIFADADTFPSIIVVGKPGEEVEDAPGDRTTTVCLFPREALGKVELSEYVAREGYQVREDRFSARPWSLERPEVDELMDKIRGNGVPLKEFLGERPYYGIKTGYNRAFLIDGDARERLVAEDPQAAEVIKPYLRGQDMARWLPEWAGLWMILLKSSENHGWPWSDAENEEEAEETFKQTYPSIYAHLRQYRKRLVRRYDQGRYWWELRSCTYYEAFELPKLLYQEIQFHPAYSYDERGFMTNNKAFILSTSDLYLLAVLNSPLMWWYNWRYLPHMKDEALSPKGDLMESLPIAPPTESIRTQVEPPVEQLLALTAERRAVSEELLSWLRAEFGIKKPGQRLESFATLAEDGFIAEVKKRSPRPKRHLVPAEVSLLRETFGTYAPRIRALGQEMETLERRLAALVNEAYGLTEEEVAWLWHTAPPRMPVAPPEDAVPADRSE